MNRAQGDGAWNTFINIIDWPLTLLRDYSIPPAEEENWDRTRAAILPMTMPLTFVTLMGFIAPPECAEDATIEECDPDAWDLTVLWVGLYCMIPGALCGLLIRFRTKFNAPPPWL